MPVIPVDGAEEFANRPVRRRNPRICRASVRLHDVDADIVDRSTR